LLAHYLLMDTCQSFGSEKVNHGLVGSLVKSAT
jgi:hypothetical protein